ncbi:MAG: hypothetical protein QOE06_974 [Thermoleophilaceae bacterium]|jgi:hypothetical protein|nr:hypothetical protein [Thermoleophilaceae bacterium]
MIERGIDGGDPVGAEPVGRVVQEERRRARSSRFARGTLACPECDAPVAPARAMSPAEPLECPFCERAGAVRDFLSLTSPSRPAHVDVRVVRR